jgi:hypothetical protein
MRLWPSADSVIHVYQTVMCPTVSYLERVLCRIFFLTAFLMIRGRSEIRERLDNFIELTITI